MTEIKNITTVIEQNLNWLAPTLPEEIPHGDMPGDKVSIQPEHIHKAAKIFPALLKNLLLVLNEKKEQKAVITVCGGSGVGKSEIASLLSFYLNELGIGAYTLSGDNYPHKIPMYNDAERLHVFREAGLRGMVQEHTYTKERFQILQKLQKKNEDADKKYITEYPWLKSYIRNGEAGLKDYLGTTKEIGFEDLTAIIEEFKAGADKIWLKRMGRTAEELWFDEVDFSKINVLVIEWTHGNSDNYQGVDVPILLNSTPQETLAHRRARNRDGATDSSFTMLVLELEQKMLRAQAHKAKIILSKDAKLLSYEEYCNLMEESGNE